MCVNGFSCTLLYVEFRTALMSRLFLFLCVEIMSGPRDLANILMLRTSALWMSPQRAAVRLLTTEILLETVRCDPGQTAKYYAARYFGSEQESAVSCSLWSELKRFGLVTMDRRDGPSEPPRWFAVKSQPYRARVSRHCDDDVDLSVLQQSAPQEVSTTVSEQQENAAVSDTSPAPQNVDDEVLSRLTPIVLSLVAAHPSHDLPFYLAKLLSDEDRRLAPLVFRQLRLDGKLLRERASKREAFVWKVSG